MILKKKRARVLLLIFLFTFFFVLGKRFSHYSLKRSLQEEHDKVLSLGEQLNNEVYRNIAAKSAIEEIYSSVKQNNNRMDSTRAMTALLYEHYCPRNAVLPKITYVERNQSWEEALEDIKSELFFSKDWFDTVSILSAWLYQNTRVGNAEYSIQHVLEKNSALKNDTPKSLGAEWYYNINRSDSVISDCGFHCQYASLLYDCFGIKSYHLSLRDARGKSTNGHMINLLLNPHNHKWYMMDHYFGIRYRYEGQWLDMETYMRLSKQQLHLVDVETFGSSKFHIYDSPFILSNSWTMDNIEITSAEVSNYKNRFRIVAPFTLRKQFPQQFKALFDSIAASYHQPPHVDWIDLARRMPLYGARLFSPLHADEQPYADSLLAAWKKL